MLCLVQRVMCCVVCVVYYELCVANSAWRVVSCVVRHVCFTLRIVRCLFGDPICFAKYSNRSCVCPALPRTADVRRLEFVRALHRSACSFFSQPPERGFTTHRSVDGEGGTSSTEGDASTPPPTGQCLNGEGRALWNMAPGTERRCVASRHDRKCNADTSGKIADQ